MNPYTQEPETLKTISMFHSYAPKVWQRGDYLTYFSEKSGYPIGRVGTKLKGMQDLRTLAYIKSRCDADEREGRKGWRHAFNSALYVPVDNFALH